MPRLSDQGGGGGDTFERRLRTLCNKHIPTPLACLTTEYETRLTTLGVVAVGHVSMSYKDTSYLGA